MRGYTFLITTRTINDYINGCIESVLKNNFKIILLFSLFSYICDCDNTQINNQINNYIEMAIDNRIKDGRGKPSLGNAGITGITRKYELGGKHDEL